MKPSVKDVYPPFWGAVVSLPFILKALYMDYRIEPGMAMLWALTGLVFMSFGAFAQTKQNVQGEDK